MATSTPEEERWRLALDSASFGVWDLNPQRDLVHYSAPWKARLGLPGSDAPDSTAFWRSRVHPDDLDAMLLALRTHLDGFSGHYEMQFRLRGGSPGWRTVLSRGRVVERDERGNAVRVVGTMVDLTGRPADAPAGVLEHERRSRLSHELRTPLHAILGLSYLLTQRVGQSSEEEQRRYLACIESSSRQLLDCIDDLLDLAARDGRGRLQ